MTLVYQCVPGINILLLGYSCGERKIRLESDKQDREGRIFTGVVKVIVGISDC